MAKFPGGEVTAYQVKQGRGTRLQLYWGGAKRLFLGLKFVIWGLFGGRNILKEVRTQVVGGSQRMLTRILIFMSTIQYNYCISSNYLQETKRLSV